MSGFWRCVVYAVVLALAAHPLGQALPRRFHPERPPFRPWKWEKNGRIYHSGCYLRDTHAKTAYWTKQLRHRCLQ